MTCTLICQKQWLYSGSNMLLLLHSKVNTRTTKAGGVSEFLLGRGSFQMSQYFASGGQSIGVSTSASVLPMNIQDWFPLGWTGWISLQSRDSQGSSLTPRFKNMNSSALSFLYSPTLTSIHDYWKNHGFDYIDLSPKEHLSYDFIFQLL